MRLILAEELDTLTVQDIQEWDERAGDAARLFIDVIDKRNLTSERWARLESLVRERESRAVDADELNTKLRQISPRRFPPPSDTASTASTASIPTTAGAGLTEEEVIAGVQRIAYRDHEKLRSVGGRPSRAINPDPGPCPASRSDIDKRYHVSDHWHGEAVQIEDELTRWLDFRWRQFKVREDSKVFNKFKEATHKYQEKQGIDRAVELQLDRQTKLDEWWEYYIYEHWKHPALERELEQAKRELEPRKEEMRKAERNGSVGVDWSSRAEELVRYKEKISRAQKEVDQAQKRLNVLRVQRSLSAVEKGIMITQAEKDLESARKRLESQKSEELEQLLKEVERGRAQARLRKQQGKVDYANTRLKQLDTLLEWIAGQFAEITTEYASSGWESQHNRDLLDGWEKYYVYMRERLQATQERDAEDEAEWLQQGWLREQTEAEELRHDLRFPQGRVSPLKALLAWIEREFPEIAAKYAPSSQDSQSNGDHQGGDQAILPHSKPSGIESARKASRLNGRKSTQRKGRPARKQSPLSQVPPSKVSKPIQRRRYPLNEKLNATRHAVWPPEDHANDVGQVKEQGQPKVAVRRSKQISQRTCDPTPTLVRAREKSPRCRPGGTLRRSARILERTEKLHSLGSDQEAKPAQSSTTARRKPTRHTAVHTDAAYYGTPQGVSKTRRWKSTSKKGKNV
ncbi:hypothetical protein PMIN06_010957 [Paraphaeosphaeria minitans]